MKLEVIDQIESIDPTAWNQLTGGEYPFLRHEFLVALERHGAIGPNVGWTPRFLLLHSEDGHLRGAVPAWLKTHSRGEFVFDFAWAEAHERHGLAYYPKLVAAIPWTPATGPRLLVAPGEDADTIRPALANGLRALTRRLELSSAHCLFAREDDLQALDGEQFLRRRDFHYFWHNDGYNDFEAFLAALTSRKRKKIRQERRYVREQGIDVRIQHGHELGADELDRIHALYATSFLRKTNLPVLTSGFFREIARTMGEQLVIAVARRDQEIIATAIMFRGSDTLYGRYWGTSGDYPALHFEACYYQGIDYCIRHGLQHFEPGAQGEHKIARGFLPTRTTSAHWLAEPAFQRAIADYLQREGELIDRHFEHLLAESPFRENPAQAAQS
jgi:uncharacterized protein